MNYEKFSSDLPLHRTVTFTSVEENEETMRRQGVNSEMRQLGKGKFRSDLLVRSTGQYNLRSARFSRACSMLLEPPAGTVAILFLRSPSGPVQASGQKVANDKLVVVPSGSEIDLVTPELTGSEAMTIPEARFLELAEVPCPSFVQPKGMVVLEGNTTQLLSLRDTVHDLVVHPASKPDPEQLSRLLAATIDWMGHASGDGRAERLRVNGVRRRVAKQAQEYIEEHYRGAVRMEDLCRATGVGVRTLQRCVREYFGLTVTEYLKMVRLDASRRELIASHPAEDSVTTVASRHGITHLGRFSVEFRERFGESPRQMLATRADRK